jgi:hypothetical protein
MKKIAFFLLILTGFAFTQSEKPIVEVIVDDPKKSLNAGSSRLFMLAIRTTFERNGFIVVDQSKDANRVMKNKIQYTQSGAVLDGDVKAYGKQRGIQFVSIIVVTQSEDENFILDATLQNIESSETTTGYVVSPLANDRQREAAALCVVNQILDKEDRSSCPDRISGSGNGVYLDVQGGKHSNYVKTKVSHILSQNGLTLVNKPKAGAWQLTLNAKENIQTGVGSVKGVDFCYGNIEYKLVSNDDPTQSVSGPVKGERESKRGLGTDACELSYDKSAVSLWNDIREHFGR